MISEKSISHCLAKREILNTTLVLLHPVWKIISHSGFTFQEVLRCNIKLCSKTYVNSSVSYLLLLSLRRVSRRMSHHQVLHSIEEAVNTLK